MDINPQVELEYPTLGPYSATASADGAYVLIDFVRADDTSKALRLALPASQIENFVAALLHLQKALGDKTSGVHFQEPH